MQQFFDNVTNRVGDAVPGASVYVTVTATGAAATLYSDDGVTAKANPITCDNNGEFSFYAADGVYTLTISGSGIQTKIIPGVLLEDSVDFTQSGAGAIVRTLQGKSRDTVSVLDFIPDAQHTDILGGTSTYDASADLLDGIAAANAAGKELDGLGLLIRLSETNISTAARIRNLTFQPIGATPTRTLYVTGNDVELRNVRIDFKSGDSIRPIQVADSVKGFRLDGLLMENVTALTFFRGLEISLEDTEFEVRNVTGRNLTITENGVIGDDNGSMRLVTVRSSAPTLASHGLIESVYGYQVGSDEDTDIVVVQQVTPSSLVHPIVINNVHSIGPSKRAVKIQANGPTVTNVSLHAKDSAQLSYAAVSAYGKCTVSGVKATGYVLLGVDVNGDATVTDVEFDTSSTTANTAAVLVDGGTVVAENLRARGEADGVLRVTELSASSSVTARGLSGLVQSNGIELTNTAAVAGRDISINIDGVDIECLGTGRVIRTLLAGLGTKTNARLSNFKGKASATASYVGFLDGFANVELDGLVLDGAQFQSFSVVGATRVDANNIVGRGTATAALLLNTCSNTLTTRVRSEGTSGVNITAGDNHIVNGVTVPAGATAVVETSSPTNVQTANLTAFV